MGYYKNQEDMFTKRAEKYDEKTEEYLKRARAAEEEENFGKYDRNMTKAIEYMEKAEGCRRKAIEHKGKIFKKGS